MPYLAVYITEVQGLTVPSFYVNDVPNLAVCVTDVQSWTRTFLCTGLDRTLLCI